MATLPAVRPEAAAVPAGVVSPAVVVLQQAELRAEVAGVALDAAVMGAAAAVRLGLPAPALQRPPRSLSRRKDLTAR